MGTPTTGRRPTQVERREATHTLLTPVRNRVAVLAAAVVIAIVGAAAGPAHAGTLKTIAIPDRKGELPARWLDHPGSPRANVLLPTNYDPKKRYPLLLLLSGFTNDYASWVKDGHADKVLADLDAIVVMPESGSGWYADWWNDGTRGNPAYESYYLDEVIPQIAKRYRIRPARRYHSVVGVSMGGLGSAFLGGRLPGYFGSVGVISGFLDMEYLPGVGAAQSILSGGADATSLYGADKSFYQDGHNPARQVTNLANSRIYVGVGDGNESSRGVGTPSDLVSNQAKESAILRPMADSWIAAARAADVDVTFAPHPGVHDWPDFDYDLANIVNWGLFKPVVEHATAWVNDTVATHGKLWEFGYTFDTPPDVVVHFRRTKRHLLISDAGSGVTIATSGGCHVHVATPASVKLPLCPPEA